LITGDSPASEGESVRRVVVTGAPGAGKTSLVEGLAALGVATVREAATDVNVEAHAAGDLEPWRDPGFPDRIAALQRARRLEADAAGVALTVYDRSEVCTLALALYLGHPVGPVLSRELDRIAAADVVYERAVLFVRSLGRIERTAVRTIGLEDARRFERIHEDVYGDLGFTLVEVPPTPLTDRVDLVRHLLLAEV
jgi:predicted ATPase